MHLFLTTTKNFLLMDTESGKTHTIDTNNGLYYGISFSEDLVFVGARDNIFGYMDDKTRKMESGRILTFDKNGTLKSELKAPFIMRDIHQVVYYDNKLWVTCSYDNFIAIYDFSNWYQWYPIRENAFMQKDLNHFNSIWFYNDRVYILAHNNGQSQIFVFSYPDLTFIESNALGFYAHNIWIEDDELFTCDSYFGSIRSTNGTVIRTGGFPRGVVVMDNGYFIGVSGLANREERHLVDSWIHYYNKKWELQYKIYLKKEGQVLDLQTLDVKNSAASFFFENATFNYEELFKKRTKQVVFKKSNSSKSYLDVLDFTKGMVDKYLFPEQWYEQESNFRWTASLEANIKLTKNSRDEKLKINVYNGKPDGNEVSFISYFLINGNDIFTCFVHSVTIFERPCVKEIIISLNNIPNGDFILSIKVPKLWKPFDYGINDDMRELGIAISNVIFLQ